MRKMLLMAIMTIIFLLSNSNFSIAFDKEIKNISSTLADNIAKAGKKMIAVVDFTDLQGNVTELGRFLAEELSGALAREGKGFEVVDRTHLKVLLKEHKLSQSGVIDPSTAKKLGQIAGVDALVTGTTTDLRDSVRLSVKILITETAKIIGATSCDIAKTKAIEELLGKEISTETGGETSSTTKILLKSVEEKGFLFEFQSCKLLGQTISCSLLVTNKGGDRELHVNAECDACYDMNTRIIDDLGNEYKWSGLQIGNNRSDRHVNSLLVSGVPTKMIINFGKISTRINRLSLLDIGCHLKGYKGDFRVQFRNIPLK
jgi:TolB-like protein